jgi:PII-like signaling protein
MKRLTSRKRIEVLVDKPLLRRIKALAADSGIIGYTVLPTLEGNGAQGEWQDERVSGGVSSKVIFLTLVSEDKASDFLDRIEPILQSHGLIVSVSQADIIRPDKF